VDLVVFATSAVAAVTGAALTIDKAKLGKGVVIVSIL
jgi:hypothetical protein